MFLLSKQLNRPILQCLQKVICTYEILIPHHHDNVQNTIFYSVIVYITLLNKIV